ncbi:MAG TPA: 7-carboxy-7-deazaguanine synthase QueE [Bacteroidetes bacterium]|nr:7-carboxy-7-deazaguanine synthase QueE [Bacteroidota bacterium]
MEIFYSIQGEGFHQGRAATFIRLGGCDVGCVWCDVKESWDADAHKKFSTEEIISSIKISPSEIVIVTGGEPLMHNLDLLTAELKSEGKKTHLETSGAHPFSGKWDWVCFSPKKFKEPLDEIYSKADELKIVVFNNSDFDFALEHASKVSSDCKLFLQPEWSKADKMIPLIIDFVKQNPQWEISLQIHKYLGVE